MAMFLPREGEGQPLVTVPGDARTWGAVSRGRQPRCRRWAQLGAVPALAPPPPPTHGRALGAQDGGVGPDGGSHGRQPHALALRLLFHLRHDDGRAGEVHGRTPALPCGAETRVRVSDARLTPPAGDAGPPRPSARPEEAVGVEAAMTHPRSTAARPRQAWWSRRCHCRRGRARPPAAGCPWLPAPPATPRGRPAAARPAPPPAPRAPRSAGAGGRVGGARRYCGWGGEGGCQRGSRGTSTPSSPV